MLAWGTGLAPTSSRLALGVLAWLLHAPDWPEGYWPGCYRPQVGLGYWLGCCSPQGYLLCCYCPQNGLGVLAWLLQTPGWPEVLAWLLQAPGCPVGTGLTATAHRGTGLAAAALRISWMYWSGCYRPQHGLVVLALLLQAQGWPVATGLAVTAHRGTGLAATSPMLAWGYWPANRSPPGATALSIAWGY